MALARVKNWVSNETLTSSDLNAEFNNILNNAGSLVSPWPSSNFDLDGKELILDVDADTSITADTDDQIDFKLGGTDRVQFIDSTKKVALTGMAMDWAKGTDIASVAGTTDIGAATGNHVHITGTNGITGLGTVQAGTVRIVRFAAALTLTHNATSLILPGAANITTAANDVAIFVSEGSGNWRCVSYMPATGLSAVGQWIGVADGRLTLTTGTPVTTADVTGAGTLYYTPYIGNRIAVYDGSNWKIRSFSEISLALSVSSGTNYDVFVYDNSGTLTLELTAWTNDTTRATALTTQDGIYVKTGATTRRYLGTIRASGANQTEDSLSKRFVWNCYNRVPRAMAVVESTDSWTYTTATIRQVRGSTANQLAFVRGLDEDGVRAWSQSEVQNTSAGIGVASGIGLDSTTAFKAGSIYGNVQTYTANSPTIVPGSYSGYPGLGYHFLAWLEYSIAGGTSTWIGDSGGTFVQAGIFGSVMA